MNGPGTRGLILVTGANGLVGSRLVARLATGHPIVAVGRGEARFPVAGVEYVELDLQRPEALRELIEARRPSGVVHAAAMTDVDACERDPVQAWTLNVRATEAAALGARAVGARLVALSTDYVFDGEAGPYDERAAPNPRGVYAISKYAGEQAALLLAPQAAVARVAVIYSGRSGAKRTFALGVRESLRKGQKVKAFSDQLVSPTLADNAAEMVAGLYQSGAAGIFHCAGASAVTRVEFCQALARKLGADESLIVPALLSELKLPAPRPLRCALRVGKIQELLGHGVPLTLDKALDLFLSEERAGERETS